MNPEGLIVKRLLKELENTQRVALGPGIPALVRPYAPQEIEIWSLENGSISGHVDLAIVEASEISDAGDLSLPPNLPAQNIEAGKWVVATHHTREDGEPKIVRDCRLPVSCPRCVNTIITELGVIEVTDAGLVLKEVAPGVATDDVKKKTAASLHIADDIKLMEL